MINVRHSNFLFSKHRQEAHILWFQDIIW